MSGRPIEDQEDWGSYLQIEREKLLERARGKLAQAIGFVRHNEDWEELNRLAREDEDLARQGLLELRQGEKVWHKHIQRSSQQLIR